ncbi:hypothetical protein Tco_1130644 [Tanacetum coccineum]
MSTQAHIDPETISQTDGARSSRVPIPLLDDPYMAVRQIEIPQPLPIAPSPIPPLYDIYLIVRQTHTPDAIDTESEPKEAPLETNKFKPLAARTTPPSLDHTPISSDLTPVLPLTNEEFEASEPSDTRTTSSHSTASSDFTTPLYLDHPLTQTSHTPTRVSYYRSTTRMAVRTQPTLSPGMSARIAKAAALSPSSFRKRYRSSYEIPSPSSSLTLPIRKRYRGKLELVEDTKDESLDSDTEREGLENEGPGAEEEEAAPEGPQQAVPVVDTTVDEPSGLGYGALRRHELALVEGSMPSTFEIGESSRSVLEQQRVEETPAPRSPVRATWVDPVDGIIYTDITIIITLSQSSYHSSFHQYDYPCSHMSWCVEEVILEVGAQLELHRSILHDHT